MSLLEEVMNKIVNEDMELASREASRKSGIERLAETIEIPDCVMLRIRGEVEARLQCLIAYIPEIQKSGLSKQEGHSCVFYLL